MRTRNPIPKVFTTVHTVHWISFNKEAKARDMLPFYQIIFQDFLFLSDNDHRFSFNKEVKIGGV